MLESLINIDTQILLFINSHYNSILDEIMWFVSLIWPWIPFYLTLIFIVIRNYKKERWYILISLLILITLSDQISASVIKNMVCRLRPTHNAQLEGLIHIVHNYRGGLYSFVSSHAANTFALATFASLLFRNRIFTISVIAWATLISYSRIYLGVHYPSDIICGGLLGFLLGFGIYKILTVILKSNPIKANR